MYSQIDALNQIKARGPRWAVYGGIRSGEAMTRYAETGEQAERIRAIFEEDGYHQVHVYPPAGAGDLVALGRARSQAQTALAEATSLLRAGVLRALEDGRAEAEVARAAGVDRMTVRKWAGK